MKLIRKIIIGLVFSTFLFSNIYAQLPYKLTKQSFIISNVDNNEEYLQLKSALREVEIYLDNPILKKMVSNDHIRIIEQAKILTNKSSKAEIIKSMGNLNDVIYEFNNLKEMEIPRSILEETIPDENLRKVIRNHIKEKHMTLNSIENIRGELYGSYENISSIKGIDTLKNIESIVLWKNNLTSLPESILKLNKLKYINLENNYIVNSKVTDKLENSGVVVEKDLNFIEDKPNQYSIKSREDIINVNKGENVDLTKYIYKDTFKYYEPWKIANEININKFEVNAENINIVNVNNMTIKAKDIGVTKVYVKIKESNSTNHIVITIKVK